MCAILTRPAAALVAAVLLPASLHAQVISSSDRLTNRLARELSPDVRFASSAVLHNEVSIGVDFTHLHQGGQDWALPFEWDYVPDSTWLLVLSTGVESDEPRGGPRGSGIDDPVLSATYRFAALGPLKLALTAGYEFPAHGDVGSTSGAEKLSLAGVYQLAPGLTASLTAAASRVDAAAAGSSQFAERGKVGIAWDLSGGSDVSVALQRSHAGAAGGQTAAQAIFDLPLKAPFSLSFALSRVLTGSAKDTDGEVDLVVDF